MARGRKTKLTARVQEKICQYIRLGMSYERAAILSGILERTFWRWKARGDTAKSGVYFEFCQALELADAGFEKPKTMHGVRWLLRYQDANHMQSNCDICRYMNGENVGISSLTLL